MNNPIKMDDLVGFYTPIFGSTPINERKKTSHRTSTCPLALRRRHGAGVVLGPPKIRAGHGPKVRLREDLSWEGPRWGPLPVVINGVMGVEPEIGGPPPKKNYQF